MNYEFTKNTFTMVISDIDNIQISNTLITNILLIISLPSQNKVFKMQSAGNQRLFKYFGNIIYIKFKSSLVGTSETTCVTTNYNKISKYENANNDLAFKQWFAGVIDGDGCFLVNKKGYPSLEITIGLEDLYLLHFIQNKIGGGNIKLRSGSKSYRYRVHNIKGIIHVIHLVNGYIQHNIRKSQLHRVCSTLDIPIKDTVNLTKDSHWFARILRFRWYN